MVTLQRNTFEINGIRFREIGNETAAGRVFHGIRECEDYAYGRESSITFYTNNSDVIKSKKNNATPLKKKDLKF